jgi:Histidine kinase-, DNA gyrase B-, and HSP90-like ATPase
MPIQPLSDSDISAIGSSLVLNDARSVIKELIDNALDAQANTISIEISANTLDVIQVKDNGSGISGEDRQLLCKRGCTSKIRTIEDLEKLGGSSLGFRGEALASVAGLSSTVVVTTKTDGELVGSASKFGQIGQLLRQDLDNRWDNVETHLRVARHRHRILWVPLFGSKTFSKLSLSGARLRSKLHQKLYQTSRRSCRLTHLLDQIPESLSRY